MGAVQKIFYFHVPSAFVTFAGVAVLLAGSPPQGVAVDGGIGTKSDVLEVLGRLADRVGGAS